MLYCLSSSAQSDRVPVIGFVHDEDSNPIASVTIRCAELNQSASTDANGRFELLLSGEGAFSLEISAVGYSTLKIRVNANKENREFFFTLQKESSMLDSVAVFGYSATQLANRQAYNVTAVDAQKLHNTTLDIAHVLDRMPGARLRETGGMGSDYDFSISGFSGRRIKFFLDGVPMDNFGSSFQINNIPINLAERIEVYKGVIPVWLGSDALGGAVNIITGNKYRNYLDVSYSYGSFNTHRTNINAAATSKKGLTFQLNAFQNYSDNNYKVTVDAADIRTGKYYPNTKVRRFHDQYRNETMIAQAGFVNKAWADKFLIGVTLGENYKEIQTGARLVTVFGAWHTKGNIVMPTLKYQKKDLFIKGLNATLNANYNLGKEQNIDTVHARYGWLGDSITYRGKGGETSSPTDYKYSNNAANAAATFTYDIGEKHHLALNNVFSYFDRKGHDSFLPDHLQHTLPQKTKKNILGFSYQYIASDKWSTTLFGKYLYQDAHTTLIKTDINNPNDTIYDNANIRRNKMGYGLATSYFIIPGLQLKTSYEKAYRMPESEDIFGDLVNKEANWQVQPESSDNINLGVSYWLNFRKHHRIYFNANGVYYQADNYIVYTFNAIQSKIIASNFFKASNLGMGGEARYSYKQLLTAGINLTWQNIRDRQKRFKDPFTGAEFENNSYAERIPNLPYLFGNADASVSFMDFFTVADRISIGYNLFYMHSFYLYAVNQGDPSTKRGVPEQWAHDVNMIYTLRNGRYNIGLECKNLTNARLYDNFSLQKPGRAFNVKLRYFISK